MGGARLPALLSAWAVTSACGDRAPPPRFPDPPPPPLAEPIGEPPAATTGGDGAAAAEDDGRPGTGTSDAPTATGPAKGGTTGARAATDSGKLPEP